MVNSPKFVERQLTERERHTVEWLLHRGNSDASEYVSQLYEATVVGICGCGCASIDFAIRGSKPEPAGMHVLSDYYWVDDSDHTGGIFAFAISGQLAGLEVYSMDGECDVSQLPELTRLIPLGS